MLKAVYEGIVRNVKLAILDAKAACDCIPTDGRSYNSEDLCKASLFALSGLSHIRCAESVYLCHLADSGEFESLEDIIGKFDILAREILKDYSDGHSPQWVFIHLNSLSEAVRGTVFDVSLPE